MSHIRIDGKRLWDSLSKMALIGATSDGGCNRQALTDLDKQGRELFQLWCKNAGCECRVDEMGNIFARRPGLDPNAAPVITGSHLDTQPTGGKFDGVYGVLAGLEVVRALNDANVQTHRPIDVVCWTNEEGARFTPAMLGSGVWCGEFSLGYGHSRCDKDGQSVKQALEDCGFLGSEPCAPYPIHAAFELHIEQGPILEHKSKQIGVVTGVQGMNWYDVVLHGNPCHAGPTPMDMRQDAVPAMATLIQRLYAMCAENGEHARITVGDIQVSPGARNTVPQTLRVAVDIRHPNQDVLDGMASKMKTLCSQTAGEYHLEWAIDTHWQSPAVQFNKRCINYVQEATEALNYSHQQLVSGAGHDSVYVARVAPCSMIFIPCEGGISHNAKEKASPADIEAGSNVLLHAMLRAANEH